MIYQCYHQAELLENCFKEGPYEPFGLRPALNPRLFENCPELEDPRSWNQLCEYTAMLWHWRNPGHNKNFWIGFTSHKQIKKTQFVFKTPQEVWDLIQEGKVASWFICEMFDGQGVGLSLAAQAEHFHPGIDQCMGHLLQQVYNETFPDVYDAINWGVFCNYWAMPVTFFHEWMEWSWPLIKKGLEIQANDSFLVDPDKRGLGFIVERLFNIWLIKARKTITLAGQIQRIKFTNVGDV